MKKQFWIPIMIIIIIVVVGIILIVENQNSNQIDESKETIKIGAILPLTGEMASYGKGWKNAIQLAIEDSRLKNKIQLIIEDDASCDTAQDVSATKKLVNIDNVRAIIGPACSSSFLSMVSITDENKVILISSSATSKSITGSGKYIFRTIESDAEKAIAVAEFAYNDRKFRKAALFYDIANDAFVQQKKDVETEFVKLGGKIVANESFKTGDTDFKSQLTKIKNSDADVIFIGFFPTKEGTLVLKQAKELGIDLQFISTAPEIGTPDFVNIAGELSENIIFPTAETPTNNEYNKFISDYKNKFNADVVGYGAETYDATTLLIKAIFESNSSPDNIKDAIYKLGQNYYGASGIITFDKHGDVHKPISIKIIQNGQFVPYEN